VAEGQDEVFEILIKFGLDPTKAREASDELGKLAGKTREGKKEVEEFNVHGREMHRIMHELNRITPGLGSALKAAFDPAAANIVLLTVTIGVLMKAFEEFKKSEQESIAKAKENAEAMSKAYGDVRIRVHEVKEEIKRGSIESYLWFKSLTDGAVTFEKALDATLDRIKLNVAEMKKLGIDVSGGDIKATAGALKATSNAQVKAEAEMYQDTRLRDFTKAMIGDTGGPEAIKAHKEAAAEAEKRAKAAEAEMEERIYGAYSQKRIDESKKEMETQLRIRDQEKGIAERMQREQDDLNTTLQVQEEKLKKSKHAVEALNESFNTLQTKMEGLQRAQAITEAGGVIAHDKSPISGTVMQGAQALEQLRLHHGKIREMDKSSQDSLIALTKLLTTLGVNNPAILRLLQKNHDDVLWMAEEIKRLENLANSRGRSSLNNPT
jgi:hypothetical protein